MSSCTVVCNLFDNWQLKKCIQKTVQLEFFLALLILTRLYLVVHIFLPVTESGITFDNGMYTLPINHDCQNLNVDIGCSVLEGDFFRNTLKTVGHSGQSPTFYQLKLVTW